MRATVILATVASLTLAGSLPAQESAGAERGVRQGAAAEAAPQRVASSDTLQFGGRIIPPGAVVDGPVLVVAGELRVQGTIQGSAFTIMGDIVVEQGASVTGDAVAALGRVRLEGGTIGGQARGFTGPWTWTTAVRETIEAPPDRRSTRDALALSIGWLILVLLLGIGTLIFAGGYLEGVTDVLERSFWRSFLVGVAAELGLIPALVVLCAALAVTVVGILLIPFAIVAYVLALAGLVTLGFLAMATLTGGSVRAAAAAGLDHRGRALRGMVIGVVVYLGMWVVAAAFHWSPATSAVLRTVALAITWVAATAGLGAALLSRGGTQRDAAEAVREPEEVVSWQTPTPVTGVVAARRPTPVAPRERT